MAGPEFNKIEVGNELNNIESSEIAKLKLEAFDTNTSKGVDALKGAIKDARINVITSAVGVSPEVKSALSLGEIATVFDTYVEKGDRWQLKVKEKDASDAVLVVPEWIKYIVENPQNNDLAYFIQKLAGEIQYQTAKEYTDKEIDAVAVKQDKMFGNQTRRALAGLKNWIESNTASAEKITFLSKETITNLIGANTESATINKATLNAALAQYHLIFDDNNRVKPLDGYERIDENSNNYAVRKTGDKTNSTDTDKKDADTDTDTDADDTNTPKGDNEIISKEAIHEDIYPVIFSSIKNLFTKENLAKSYEKIINNNEEIKDFLKKNKLSVYPYEQNPFITIQCPPNGALSSINIRVVIKDDELDKDALYNMINKGIVNKIIENRKIEKNKTIQSNLGEIRGKQWTLETLFPNDTSKQKKSSYRGYFNRFRDGKLTIDNSAAETNIQNNKLYFRFDEDGRDDKDSRDKSIDMSLITDETGKLDEDKFIAEIQKIVDTIAEGIRNNG